jgi:SAM-dependent methyltransferase
MEDLKKLVYDKYSQIATRNKKSACCCYGSCETDIFNMQSDDYTALDGYEEDADLGLGCGVPTKFAGLKAGDTVVDLGSGAGNDCFVARAEVGDAGRVIGVDFSEAMIAKARENTAKRDYSNVEFRQGDIEEMPVGGNSVDVVISNCVLNLLPSKDKIFHEIFRVLKPGGHFCISDVVTIGTMPDALREAAEMYVGCIAGAIPKNEYMDKMLDAGFVGVEVVKETPIEIPDKYLNAEEIERFKRGGSPVFSVTVVGSKSGCGCKSGCC